MSERWLQSGTLRSLEPDWPAPSRVRARVTTRLGGVSEGVYASLNLAAHVGDRPESVRENRLRLFAGLKLPAAPAWLNQVHGADVQTDASLPDRPERGSDAACTHRPGSVLAVLTADCLPVLFADREGTRVGIAHAGWRGLAGGVLEATVQALGTEPRNLIAWIGPGIESGRYETGPEVRSSFVGEAFADAFRPSGRPGHAETDLVKIARITLASLGVGWIGACTLGTGAKDEGYYFYSYRREGRTGRMASLIYLEPGEGGP